MSDLNKINSNSSISPNIDSSNTEGVESQMHTPVHKNPTEFDSIRPAQWFDAATGAIISYMPKDIPKEAGESTLKAKNIYPDTIEGRQEMLRDKLQEELKRIFENNHRA